MPSDIETSGIQATHRPFKIWPRYTGKIHYGETLTAIQMRSNGHTFIEIAETVQRNATSVANWFNPRQRTCRTALSLSPKESSTATLTTKEKKSPDVQSTNAHEEKNKSK